MYLRLLQKPVPKIAAYYVWRFLACTLLGLSLFLSSPTLAQVPGELVPGRQEGIEMPQPKSLPGPIAPRIGGQAAPDASKSIELTLNDLRLVGAEAVPAKEFKDIWAPYLGKTINVAKLYEIANMVTQRYAEKGYALSFAFLPEQEIGDEGAVILRVVEGYIEQAVMVGDMGTPDKPAPQNIQEMTRNIVKSKPLRSDVLERYLLLLNDLPGYKVETTFSASRTTPDASNLIVKVKRTRFTAEIKVDNHLSSSLRYWSVGATARIHGLLTDADTLDINRNCGLHCGTYDHKTLGYSTIIGTEGFKLGVRYDNTLIHPQTGLLTLVDFEGDNTTYAVDASYPLIRSRQKNLTLGGSFSVTNNETTTFLGTLTKDQVRVLDLYGNYDYADSTGAVTLARLNVSQGLPIMNYTQDDDPLRSKAGGSATFTTTSLTVSRDQPLASLLPRFSEYTIYLSGRAQLAVSDALLSTAQCFYGGDDFGRGYDSGAIGGDHCMMASAELRRGFQIKRIYAQAYAFIDAGAVWRKAPAVGEDSNTGAQSYGLGARLIFTPKVQGDVSMSWPYRLALTGDGKDAPRTLVSLRWLY